MRAALLVDLNSKEATDLGTRGLNSHAFRINDAGQAVGQSDLGNGQLHAFIAGPAVDEEFPDNGNRATLTGALPHENHPSL